MSDTPAPDETRRFDRKKFIGVSAAAAASPMLAGAQIAGPSPAIPPDPVEVTR